MNASPRLLVAVAVTALSLACESASRPPAPESAPESAPDPAQAPAGEQIDMKEMMKRAEKYTQPGPHHAALEKLLGTWDTEIRVKIPGRDVPPEKGSSTCSWLMKGRWVKCEATGTVMGMPAESFVIFGYDNFKMSYRIATVTSLDTALNTSEGDMDPSGKALVTYGTLDEYLTGEHDKMVKTIWRFQSADEFVMEVYDLPIGETNNQVLAQTYRRRKG